MGEQKILFPQKMMLPLVDTNFNFLIEITPKSACTIITKMFFHQQNLLTKALEYSDWIHNYKEDIYYPSLPKDILKKVYNNTNIYKFKFVRNPYTRAVSSYLEWCRLYESTYPDIQQMSFRTFLRQLKKENIPYDVHFSPQIGIPVQIFDEVFQVEELDAALQVLSSKYNIHFENIFSSTHHRPKSDIKDFWGDKPYHQIQSIPKYKYFYDIEIQHLVEEIYYNDIEQLPYTFMDIL